MGWPQYTLLALFLISLLINAHKHGQPKDGYHHFGYSVAALCIWLPLLYFGGFFGGCS